MVIYMFKRIFALKAMPSALRVFSNPSFLLTFSRMSLRASPLRALAFTLVYQGLADMLSPSKSHSSSHPHHGDVNCGKQPSKIYLGI